MVPNQASYVGVIFHYEDDEFHATILLANSWPTPTPGRDLPKFHIFHSGKDKACGDGCGMRSARQNVSRER
jgi:hypothetical protein